MVASPQLPSAVASTELPLSAEAENSQADSTITSRSEQLKPPKPKGSPLRSPTRPFTSPRDTPRTPVALVTRQQLKLEGPPPTWRTDSVDDAGGDCSGFGGNHAAAFDDSTILVSKGLKKIQEVIDRSHGDDECADRLSVWI